MSQSASVPYSPSLLTSAARKLAWSNTGSIARIPTDGSHITFRAMVKDKKTAMWKISTESKHPIPAPEGRKFVHIAFSGIGIEMAAVDNVGAVHIFSLQGPLSRMVAPGGFDAVALSHNSKTEADSVVGLHWLPLYSAEFRVGRHMFVSSMRSG